MDPDSVRSVDEESREAKLAIKEDIEKYNFVIFVWLELLPEIRRSKRNVRYRNSFLFFDSHLNLEMDLDLIHIRNFELIYLTCEIKINFKK